MAEDLNDLTKDELLSRAADADVEGRSSMNKDELIDALEAESSSTATGGDAASGDPLRHTPGSTTPKTGPVPPTFPAEPVNVPESDGRFGLVPNMSSSRIGEKTDAAAEQAAESRASS